MNREQDVVDAIDALVDEQMAGGEPRGGFDYYDPAFPRCPHCRRHWHGLAITTRIEEMAAREVMDEDYRYSEDDSPVLCPGSEFIGPVATPEQLHWMRLDDDTKRRFPHGYIPTVNEMILAAMQSRVLHGDMSAAAPYNLPELEFPNLGQPARRGDDIPDWIKRILSWTNPVVEASLARHAGSFRRARVQYRWASSINFGDRVAFVGRNGFRYEGIARVEHRGLETTIHLDETEESTAARNEGIRGFSLDYATYDETAAETPQQRALPRPSHEPPMWANNPTRTRRIHNRATNARTPLI